MAAPPFPVDGTAAGGDAARGPQSKRSEASAAGARLDLTGGNMRRTLSAVVVVALAVGAAACGPHTGGAIPTGVPVYDIVPGASTIIQPGVQAGYGITANTGGVYRLVWTGDQSTSGVHRSFYGSV